MRHQKVFLKQQKVFFPVELGDVVVSPAGVGVVTKMSISDSDVMYTVLVGLTEFEVSSSQLTKLD